jgi:hypothetical protein
VKTPGSGRKLKGQLAKLRAIRAGNFGMGIGMSMNRKSNWKQSQNLETNSPSSLSPGKFISPSRHHNQQTNNSNNSNAASISTPRTVGSLSRTYSPVKANQLTSSDCSGQSKRQIDLVSNADYNALGNSPICVWDEEFLLDVRDTKFL